MQREVSCPVVHEDRHAAARQKQLKTRKIAAAITAMVQIVAYHSWKKLFQFQGLLPT